MSKMGLNYQLRPKRLSILIFVHSRACVNNL